MGASAGYFLLEMDGVTFARASEVSGIGLKHEVVKIGVGDQANPILVRGKYEPQEVTVKHAHALNNTAQEVFSWFKDYIKGFRTDKLTMRLIQMDEDGYSPLVIWEMVECAPTEFSQEGNKGDSKDASYFMLKFMPTDVDFI